MIQGEPICVIIADDREEIRAGLATFLKVFDDMRLVGEAENGMEVVALCLQLQPDVVLMDLTMPEMDGICATRLIRQNCPDTQVIVLTAVGDPEIIQEARRAGAFECIAKDVSIDAMAQAVRAASSKQIEARESNENAKAR